MINRLYYVMRMAPDWEAIIRGENLTFTANITCIIWDIHRDQKDACKMAAKVCSPYDRWSWIFVVLIYCKLMRLLQHSLFSSLIILFVMSKVDDIIL